MKTHIKIILLWIALSLPALWTAGCSTSRCCDPAKPIQALDTIFVRQAQEGTVNMKKNVHSMRQYFKHQWDTSGSRMADTASDMYNGASLESSANGLSIFFGTIGKQIVDGAHALPQDFRAIGQCLCVCGD